jgi:23S rRNA G2069 N7-methylase RlmK/C1962 C5-methylase RlmI
MTRPWAERYPCTAYRIYDRDIPEFAVSIDVYGESLVVNRYFNNRFAERDELNFHVVLEGLKEVFAVNDDQIFVKERARQKGLSQYQKVSHSGARTVVQEGPVRLIVNLSDYLDTGLFLDHRESRRWVYKNSEGLRVLNLFCYTGSVSIHAIAGGARQVVSVDMSATYLQWAQENLELNKMSKSMHPLVRADVLEWLRTLNCKEKFDLIFLDPPSFSNSKKMASDFDVQRDHVWLVQECMQHLNDNGTLFFSNNLRTFKLDAALQEKYKTTDISKKTLPPDFNNELIHKAWLIRQRPTASLHS